MKHSLCMVAIVAIGMFLVGCDPYPGYSELAIKTSDFNKAMRGEVAEIMVKVENSFDFSGANRMVVVGAREPELGRDFALVVAGVYSNMFSGYTTSQRENVNSSRRTMTFNIEDRKDECPILKMMASYPVTLIINPKDGILGCRCINNDKYLDGYYTELIAGASRVLDSVLVLPAKNLNDEDSEYGARSVESIVDEIGKFAEGAPGALWMEHLTFLIEGDDDKPVFVVGKEIKVNDKPVANYRTWIRKGDKVRIEANAKMTGNGVRFFETEAQADAAEPIEHK